MPPRPPPPAASLDDTLAAPLTSLRGLGGKRAAAWHAVGVSNVRELLAWPPRRHLRFERPQPIATLSAGQDAVVRVVLQRKQASGRRGIVATRLFVRDESGELCAALFGPRWLAQAFGRHEELVLRGTVQRRGDSLELLVRQWLHAEELPPADVGAPDVLLQPHYELPDAIAPRLHRRCVRAALAAAATALAAPLPEHARSRISPEGSAPTTLGELFMQLHFPRSEADALAARRQLALDAAIAIQWRLAARRTSRPRRRGGALAAAGRWCAEYVAAWPHAPTADQRQALAELVTDYARPTAMARLLSGDVGTGKTLVALLPLVVAARTGRQGALLAPTELLARQHHATLTALAERLRLPPPRLLVAGSDAAPDRRSITEPWVVGTHRLFAERSAFTDLGAVVVDEQHKFGVQQRGRLLRKGEAPDLLLVSATPIPRTLAQTLFGHLDPSFLRERPFARRQVRTELVFGSARAQLADRLRAEVAAGGKVFLVCPAIAAGGAARGRAAAERVFPWVERELRGAASVALLHGRLTGDEKQARLAAFAASTVRVLVATVVVEVGIDVPDATMVVALDADRFGLSQLHQLRGRVGRRGDPATCLVVSADPAEEARVRLEAFAAEDDGFRLAELDLRQRGPGELFGLRQHGLAGSLYPEALLDPELLERARAAVAAGACKSLLGKPFESLPVASSEAIW